MTKPDIIKKVYVDPSGYGSIENTLTYAKQIDSTTKLEYVKEFFSQYVEQKKQVHGAMASLPAVLNMSINYICLALHIWRIKNTKRE